MPRAKSRPLYEVNGHTFVSKKYAIAIAKTEGADTINVRQKGTLNLIKKIKVQRVSNPSKGKWLKVKAVKFNRNGSVSIKK